MEEWFEGDGFQLHWPYQIRAIRSLQIEQRFGEHTRCLLTVVMTDEQSERCLNEASFEDSLLIRKIENSQEDQWFSGGISNLGITMEDGIPIVRIEAISRSYEMDIKPKSRSYQNKYLTYTKLIKGLTEGYKRGDAQNEATEPGATIGELIVQYQETDWQFMKRLASRLGTVILPDITMDAPRVYFGVPDFSWGKEFKATHYSMIQNRESYLSYREQAVENGGEISSEIDWISYRARSSQYFRVGENVGFKRQIWVIAESIITYDKGALQYEYVLVKRQALRRKSRLNKAIQGVALEGRVLKRANNMVKVQLDIDEEYDDSGNWWFPYSPEGNNIFHCMPDEGGRIKIYFPNGIEKQAIAINSVRERSEEMKTRTVFQKPTTKVFHMPGDAKMELGEDGVLFEKNTVSIKLDGDNIDVSAEENILVVAVNTIELTKAESASKLESIKMKAKHRITHITNENQFVEIAGSQVLIQNKTVNFQKVEMNFFDMLTDDDLEKLSIEKLFDIGIIFSELDRKRDEKEITWDEHTALLTDYNENPENMKRDLATMLRTDPKIKEAALFQLRGMKEDALKSYYQEKNSPVIEGETEERTNEEIKLAHEKYEAAYKNYNTKKKIQHELIEETRNADAKETKGKSPSPSTFMKSEESSLQSVSPELYDLTIGKIERQQQEYEALKDVERKRMHGQTVEALTPQSAIMKGLAQGLENLENSDFWLENVIPKKPDYFSKQDQTVTYLSRFSFLVQVAAPQRGAAMFGVFFGAVAIVLAIPTAGKSLYLLLLAGAEIGVGVMQLKVNLEKLHDLGEGNYYSNPTLFGMDQTTLNKIETGVAIVNLPLLFKPNNLKVADKFKDSQRLTAFKEAAGDKYTSFKATMNDVNIMMNPWNYRRKLAPELNYGFGSTRLDIFPRFQRVGDEPFIQFSRRGSGGTGNGVPVIKNNFEFINGFDDHMINAQGIVRKGNKGVVGGHNLENFEKILTDQGWNLDDVIVSRTSHPTVTGVYEIEYRLPALDRELKVVPGQYKNIPQPKTVYDSNLISNEQMIVWGKEAMENGVINGRLVTGYSSNGLRFTGYLDDSGNITNFHPSFEGN
ncbi:CdiA family toxin C-terminal domain-containing protein [Paenibacillus lentus]|uniref:Bacterial EndoU nuclease domain-containing protein n=1 Tax=Paenibacillus lentus TaxID=1338368 RepID=A0A3Q8S6M0_9BACL|nr:CdiA family toxin C-terminal domain-containing protein [Paenibacillus lentus]AZK48563.1 hypothetical protein EIM92_22250 [Paenibacillus lentus]